VTRKPTAEWLARQITEAFLGTESTYLIRDNDRAFGAVFRARIRAMGIRDRPTSFRSPWQNGLVERLIGSARRECTDHVIVFNEEHNRHQPIGLPADEHHAVRRDGGCVLTFDFTPLAPSLFTILPFAQSADRAWRHIPCHRSPRHAEGLDRDMAGRPQAPSRAHRSTSTALRLRRIAADGSPP
jgi:hypothetical protein